MKLAASDSRKTIASASSSGFPPRPIGIASAIVAAISGALFAKSIVAAVLTCPGTTAFTRMPLRAPSMAAQAVNWMSAAFEAE